MVEAPSEFPERMRVVATDLTALSWRTGRSLGRTIYARTGGEDDWKADTVIGMMDTPELAEAACAAHNEALKRTADPMIEQNSPLLP
jgi:hypothetical protein